jgi:nickel-dependent lactate racemase
LKKIGIIKEDEVSELTYGLLKQKVDVSINRMVFNYDLLLIIGPTFPHEVVGFSGGNKYLFPGIAGGDIINMFHWLGALITNPVINGEKFTPVRAIIDKAASFVRVNRLCLSLVVRGESLAGLYVGTPEEAWEKAADLSEKIHIIYKEKLFRKILSCAPKMYDDIWTAGKCMYKLENVVEDGGELIIYAPHIREISVTHGHIIEKIGYHVRDYFFKQMDRFKTIPAGVMAHATHVRGIGTYENGIEKPRIKVTLATQIPKKLCKKINLGYLNPDEINIEEWKNREDEGILYVPKAGEELYRLKSTVLDVIE